MAIDEKVITINDWVIRMQRPEGNGPFGVWLMLHGWTGDENSMWIFAPSLPKQAIKLAPRGLFTTQEKGYSWHAAISKPWPWMDDFQPAVNALLELVSGKNFPDGDFSQLHLIGFSQGAALAYAMAIMYPERITSLVGLSGFIPDGASAWLRQGRLTGLPVFIAHGTEDELVPVERARGSVELLKNYGAKVTYCEDRVGHKLSANCLRGLGAFYQRINDRTE
jgi:phospholipase/carboxylesterase